MSVKPIDLQVNIQSLIETSRDHGARQATILQEQRLKDLHNLEDGEKKNREVNSSAKSERNEPLKDNQEHFGNLTESELENEHSRKQEKKHHEKGKESSPPKPNDENDHIDYLA